ncbi:hypothetical protein B0T19DRAFT_417577 [Cercophora scortea]|uniref:Uncharacterized protein n=1 Tax=Cercophora scortea TaxID=314031 RepID=A0AAE0IXY2_9PEZI|nr:hypothetical protein B0T19DRAFT_417577 [Cercophora scortea]
MITASPPHSLRLTNRHGTLSLETCNTTAKARLKSRSQPASQPAMDGSSLFRRDRAPDNYSTPPFPSLRWSLQDTAADLYTLHDIWRFTLLWTLIIFGSFHLAAVSIALLMQVGRPKSNWEFLWLVPLIYAFIAGLEAILAGSVVGLMSVPIPL